MRVRVAISLVLVSAIVGISLLYVFGNALRGVFDSVESGLSASPDPSPPPAIGVVPTYPVSRCASVGIVSEDGCADYTTLVSQLKTAEIAYNRPTEMMLGVRQDILLLLDLQGNSDLPAALTGLQGDIVEGSVRAARSMSATLSGSAFDIDPDGTQTKLVTAAAPVQWAWTVEPVEPGANKPLILEIFIHIAEGGQISAPISIRTYRDSITVTVTTWERVRQFAAELQPIHALIAAMAGSLWALVVWYRKRKRHRLGKVGLPKAE